MANEQHYLSTDTDNHVVTAFTFATAVARAAGTGYSLVPADKGKIAIQSDDVSFWILQDDSPITWAPITLVLSSTDALYFGEASTNGTWRIIRDGNNLNFERRESGTYVKKMAATA